MKKGVVVIIAFVVLVLLFLFVARFTGFASNVSSTSVDICQDSDAGINVYEKGFVNGAASALLGKKIFYEYDTCIDERTLVEWSCKGSGENYHKNSQKYQCPQRCIQGVCKR